MQTICDRCGNYEVSPAGCLEKCWAQIEEILYPIVNVDSDYVAKRMSGEMKSCKRFKKL